MPDRASPAATSANAREAARAFCLRLRGELEVETPQGPILLPSPGVYRSVFAWDAGWHYYWLRRLDPARARAELGTLFARAEPDGRVPHEAPVAGGPPYRGLRRLQLALLGPSFAPSGSSWLVDPPIYLVSAAEAAAAARAEGSVAEAEALLAAGRRALAWIESARRAPWLEPPWDGLPALLHPLESGTDFSPSFDAMWGPPPLLQLRSLTLLRPLARRGWSLAEGAAPRRRAGSLLLFDPCYLAFYLGSRRRLLPGPAAERLIEDYWEAAFDPAEGLFRQAAAGGARAARPGAGREAPVRRGRPTFSGMLPLLLYARGPRREAAREAVARNALPGGRFWELELPSFNPGARKPSGWLWRGAQCWLNMAYCHWSLLGAYGFGEEAEELLNRLTRRISGGKAPEWLDPRPAPPGSGGGGAAPFSWNGLWLAMAEGAALEL